jgi:hypothetical protein
MACIASHVHPSHHSRFSPRPFGITATHTHPPGPTPSCPPTCHAIPNKLHLLVLSTGLRDSPSHGDRSTVTALHPHPLKFLRCPNVEPTYAVSTIPLGPRRSLPVRDTACRLDRVVLHCYLQRKGNGPQAPCTRPLSYEDACIDFAPLENVPKGGYPVVI